MTIIIHTAAVTIGYAVLCLFVVGVIGRLFNRWLNHRGGSCGCYLCSRRRY